LGFNPSATICVIVGSLDSGGCERHLLRILPRIDRSEFDVYVFTLSREGALAEEMRARGIQVTAPWCAAKVGRSSCARRFLRLFLTSVQLAIHLIFRRPKIVHFFLPGSYLLGAPIALLCGRRNLIMSRRSLNRYQQAHRFAARVERWLHPRMAMLLGNSTAVVEELSEECPAHPRIELIYNGIEIDASGEEPARSALRSNLLIPADTIAIGIVANLIPYKGHSDLLRACAQLQVAGLPDWELFIIGRDDGVGEQLLALATELGIDSRVRFMGECYDARKLLPAFDIGVSASHEEGFSNSILEFMAVGLPVVATEVGGSREAVQDGLSGLLVPPRNPCEMAEAIKILIGDSSRRREMGLEGKNLVARKFSAEKCVEGYERAYRAILSD